MQKFANFSYLIQYFLEALLKADMQCLEIKNAQVSKGRTLHGEKTKIHIVELFKISEKIYMKGLTHDGLFKITT